MEPTLEPLVTDIAQFSEHRFPPAEEARAEYEHSVAFGRAVMSERTAVFCGLARNVAHVLPGTIARIERLAAMFADYRVVVYENDSTDATRELLTAWRVLNPRVIVLSEDSAAPRNPQRRCLRRAARMADYRNIYRQFVAERFSDFDCAIIVDTDLSDGWSYDGVATTFARNDWDFVGSYGVIYRKQAALSAGPYLPSQFDAWAFRPRGFWEPISAQTAGAMRWRRGDPFVPVNSCFGGLGVYRMEAMLAAQYGGGDCEHVTFHRRLAASGIDRFFLNPSQIVHYGRKERSLDRLAQTCRDVFFFRLPMRRSSQSVSSLDD